MYPQLHIWGFNSGKPYYVYMTAAANKFLRIYYARVKEALNALEDSSEV